MMLRNELPETCFAILPDEGRLIILKRGEKGYYPSEWETGNRMKNKKIADWHNYKSGINPAQAMAMQIGSMFGFDVPGADPQSYFDSAQPVTLHWLGQNAVLYTGDFLCEPMRCHVREYKIAGETSFYLDLTLMPESVLGLKSNTILLPDLVGGHPLVPVSLERQENGGCEMSLEHNAAISAKEQNAGFQIIAKARIGPIEYALGEHGGKFPSFVTWERTPANDGDGPPNYYWGHFFESRIKAILDFCSRTAEKYAMLSEQRKPSIKEKLAVKPVPGKEAAGKPKAREER